MKLLRHNLVRPELWPVLLLVAGLPLIATAWTLASRTNVGSLPGSGGRYVEGVVGAAPQRINPLFAASGPEHDLTELVFSGLTRPGPDGSPQPDLAESWVASTDATSFTFVLRTDVQWQDGQPFDARDVVFTAAAFSAPGYRGDPATAEVWRRARVTQIGPYGVLFQFDSPFVPFLSYTSVGILPRHLLAKDTADQLVSDPFNQHPVGTGPFRLRSLSASGAELTTYAGYHLGAPYLSQLSLRYLPDAAALLSGIRAKRVDGGVFPSPLATDQLDALRRSGHAIYGGLRPAYDLVYLNLNLAQFQDAVVRQALSLATDRERLVQQVMGGQAAPADVPLPPGSWPGSDAPPAANVAVAKTLLQQAGWIPDQQGTLRRRGISLAFTLQTTPDPQRRALADALAAQWQALGASVKVETVDEEHLLSDVLLPHKYEAVLYGWDPGPDPDPFTAWHSSQRGDQGRNLSGYASPRADQLLESARQTADAGDRAQIYAAFVDLFRQDVPGLVLFFPRYAYVLPERMNGVELGLVSSPADRLAGAEDWSLVTRRN
jgi:peptide/nickel transport system substrate-binding protein